MNKEHLGDEFWVSVENRVPVTTGAFKAFAENNFELPNDIKD